MHTALLAALLTLQPAVRSPYLDVVWLYRAGDHARAIDELSSFPTVGVRQRALRDLTQLVCQTMGGLADCRRLQERYPDDFERVRGMWALLLPAAAALHVETASAAHAAGRLEASQVHRRLALEIADLSAALSSAADVPSDLRRRVYVLAIWLLQLESDLDAILELEKVLMRAQEHFPQDPLVLLAGGTYHEHRARPHVLRLASDGRGGDAEAWRREERAWRIQKAEAQYREVLRIDAGQAEAHLRLARVLLLQRRADEARAALDRAHEAATEARLRYLVAMFRAAAVESDGEAGDARAHYAEALRIWPEAQSPRLGLSRLHASAGDWSAALEWLRGLETPPSRGPQFDDPWWAYDFGQVWRFESGVLELRKVLHP